MDSIVKTHKEKAKNISLKKKTIAKNNNFTNIAIFLHDQENAINDDYKVDIIAKEFMEAISQDVQVVIASSSVVKPIFNLYNEFETIKKNSNFQKSLYKNKINNFFEVLKDKLSKGTIQIFMTNHWKEPYKQEFVVIVSKKECENLDLKKLGLDSWYLIPLNIAEIDSKIEPISDSKYYVDHLKRMFYTPNGQEEVKKIPRKLIYLTGHGLAGEKISDIKNTESLPAGKYAGINLNNFLDLLKFLGKIKSELFFISTCFSGGWNSLKLLKNPVSFSIALNAISDNTTCGGKVEFNVFYKNLRELFSNGKPKVNWIDNEKFKDAIRSLAGNQLDNTPSVCFPGSLFFKVVDVNNNIKKIEKKDLWVKNKKVSCKIDNSKKAVLFYSNVIDEILNGNIPKFISMIPGKANHFIEGIYTNLTFMSLIKRIIGEEEDLKIYSPKLFFVGGLSCKGDRELNLSDLNRHDIRNLYFIITVKENKENEEYIHIKGAFLLRNATKKKWFSKNEVSDVWLEFEYDTDSKTMIWTKIDKESYIKDLVSGFSLTTPTKEAFLRANPHAKCTIKTPIGNYYAFQKPFIFAINHHLGQEGLELYVILENHFKTIKCKKEGSLKNSALTIEGKEKKNKEELPSFGKLVGGTTLTIVVGGIAGALLSYMKNKKIF